MRVLITGSSGQIGTNLGLALLNAGHDVVGIDQRPNEWTERIPTTILDLATTPVEPVSDELIGSMAFGSVDAVVHLAAHAKVHALVERPLGAFENHTMVTTMLEYARRNRVPVLIASSREVYGNTIARGVPVRETAADFRAAPSPYAAMKLASESLAASYFRCYGTPFAVVRLSNVYGRYDHDLWRLERAIWVFRERILNDRPVTVYGADKVLDFTHVDDAVAGIQACLAHTNHSCAVEAYLTRLAPTVSSAKPLTLRTDRVTHPRRPRYTRATSQPIAHNRRAPFTPFALPQSGGNVHAAHTHRRTVPIPYPFAASRYNVHAAHIAPHCPPR